MADEIAHDAVVAGIGFAPKAHVTVDRECGLTARSIEEIRPDIVGNQAEMGMSCHVAHPTNGV